MLSVLCPEIFIATDRGTPAGSIFLTVAVPAYSNPPSPAPSKNSENQKTHPAAAEEKPAYNPAGTDKQPFVVKILEVEKTPKRTEQERPEREEKSANERRLIIDTKEAAQAARKSADAAERTVTTMRDTAEKQLRAYVMVGEVRVVNDASPMPRIADRWIYVTIENFGRTISAAKIRSTLAVCVNEYPSYTTLDGGQRSQKTGVIAPHNTFTARFPLRNDLKVRDPRTALYIHGEVHYFDGFEDRITPIRFRRRGARTGSGMANWRHAKRAMIQHRAPIIRFASPLSLG